MKAEVLESIISFADHAHGDQKRKYSDERYIVHLIRVMQTCQQYSHDPAVLAAALLHDVLEDTAVTKKEISEFLITIFDHAQVDKTLLLVEELTDVYVSKNFSDMNRQKRKEKEIERLSELSHDAQTIKYADVIDNSINIVQHDHDFGYVYLKECKALLDKMNNGNQHLYERAVHTVTEGMDRVRKIDA